MEERRNFPRFDVILPATIQQEDVPLQGTIFDISSSGMQIGCDSEMAHRLLPEGQLQVTPADGVDVEIHFGLPGCRDLVMVITRLVVIRRVADDEYRLGLDFQNFKNNSEATLKGYLEVRMREIGIH